MVRNQSHVIKWIQYLKAGFRTNVSKTHSSAQCLPIYGHHCSQTNPPVATQACVLTSKLHMLNLFGGCEACASMHCDCDLWDPRTKDTKDIFCPPEKKSKTQETVS